MTLEEYVRETAARGGSINTMFEERLFALVGTLERIAVLLSAEDIPYELIGGVAVMAHVLGVEPSAVRNTRGIDIMVLRTDLERIEELGARNGFSFRHATAGETKALNPIHLIFSSEKVRQSQAVPNPPIRPDHVSVHGVTVAVIAVADLVAMKLSNNRDIDRVHVRDLDSVGLITPSVESLLPDSLQKRLQEIRGTE